MSNAAVSEEKILGFIVNYLFNLQEKESPQGEHSATNNNPIKLELKSS